MINTTMFLLLVAASTSPVSFIELAEQGARDYSLEKQVDQVEDSKLYRTLGYLTYVSKAGDFVSTEYGLNNGAVEANPLMQNRGVRLATTVAMPMLVNWGSNEVKKSGHPNGALWMRIAYVALHGFVIQHNLRQ
jgi:hypothetical protein